MVNYTQHSYWDSFSFGGDALSIEFLWEESSSTMLLIHNIADGSYFRVYGSDFQFGSNGVTSGAIHSMYHYADSSEATLLTSITTEVGPMLEFDFGNVEEIQIQLWQATFDPYGQRLVPSLLRGDDVIYSGHLTSEATISNPNRLYGWFGNDTITGSQFSDWIEGGEGNDLIRGRAGDDVLIGFTLTDNVDYEDGDDTMLGGAGNDQLEGGEGNDRLFGGIGDDSFVGGNGNDRLFGGDGSDLLRGDETSSAPAPGNDILDGGPGVDAMHGRGGNDTYYVDDIGDLVIELQNEGKDTVKASVSYTLPANVEILIMLHWGYEGIGNELANLLKGHEGGDDELRGLGGEDLLFGYGGNDTLLGGDGADGLRGGDGNDVLIGGEGNDALRGDAGSDLVTGQSGNDTLNGGGGADGLAGGGGADVLRGEGGSDLFNGGGGSDILDGGSGLDILKGAGGHDLLDGGLHADELWGGAGDDRVDGGADDSAGDWLHGGGDSDRFVLHPGGGNDIVADFADGNDVLDFAAYEFADKDSLLALADEVGSDVVFSLAGGQEILIENLDLALLGAEDIII